ncbi:MAG: Rieske (2Fe-2S) protein [Cyclobacteriaceae bacterium]
MNNEVILFSSPDELEKSFSNQSILTFLHEREKFCITRVNNDLVAFNAECPHLGYSLRKAPINLSSEIVCPWHSYRFSLFTGEESQKRCKDLLLHKVYWSDKGELVVRIKKG